MVLMMRVGTKRQKLKYACRQVFVAFAGVSAMAYFFMHKAPMTKKPAEEQPWTTATEPFGIVRTVTLPITRWGLRPLRMKLPRVEQLKVDQSDVEKLPPTKEVKRAGFEHVPSKSPMEKPKSSGSFTERFVSNKQHIDASKEDKSADTHLKANPLLMKLTNRYKQPGNLTSRILMIAKNRTISTHRKYVNIVVNNIISKIPTHNEEQPSSNVNSKSVIDTKQPSDVDRKAKESVLKSSASRGEKTGAILLETPSSSHPVADCLPLHFSPEPLPLTALVSYPGSGNTWLRHLIQQATGLYTGSVYGDAVLQKGGFPGESCHNGSVIAIKTHEHIPRLIRRYKRTILLLRDPLDAILAHFNLNMEGTAHTEQAPADLFYTEWPRFFQARGPSEWLHLYSDWLRYHQGPMHIVRYEKLITDMRTQVADVARFLGYNLNSDILDCVEKNKEGNFHRKSIKREKNKSILMKVLTTEMKSYLSQVQSEVEEKLKSVAGVSGFK